MAIATFYKLLTPDQTINRVQDAIASAFQTITKIPILDGVLVLDSDLTTGTDNIVEHKLSRPFRGWIVVRQSANATVWESSTTNGLPSRQIILRSSVNCTVSLWVF